MLVLTLASIDCKAAAKNDHNIMAGSKSTEDSLNVNFNGFFNDKTFCYDFYHSI